MGAKQTLQRVSPPNLYDLAFPDLLVASPNSVNLAYKVVGASSPAVPHSGIGKDEAPVGCLSAATAGHRVARKIARRGTPRTVFQQATRAARRNQLDLERNSADAIAPAMTSSALLSHHRAVGTLVQTPRALAGRNYSAFARDLPT